MSFDEQPDGDIHGECAAEIATLTAEISRLRTELEGARKQASRYEIVRKFNVQQFSDVFKLNISTGKPFDQIIDDLAPFYSAAIAREKGDL